ncbi:hypothetical protein, partial [Rhizobium mesoamericanum]|uniref:hypothetical protein n=1 Tax=Rhizobium mesoamericanum TaxID=1079800 RepID=UPI001AEBC2E8
NATQSSHHEITAQAETKGPPKAVLSALKEKTQTKIKRQLASKVAHKIPDKPNRSNRTTQIQPGFEMARGGAAR